MAEENTRTLFIKVSEQTHRTLGLLAPLYGVGRLEMYQITLHQGIRHIFDVNPSYRQIIEAIAKAEQ